VRGLALLSSLGSIFVPPLPILPSGTRCIFDQDNPPTGWTRDTASSLDDRMIRVVVGARSDGGSWTISGLSGSGHSHAYSDNPSHTHGVAVGSHNHSVSTTGGITDANPGFAGVGGSTYGGVASGSATPSFSISPTGAASASTDPASEGISGDGMWRPMYRDAIVASKD